MFLDELVEEFLEDVVVGGGDAELILVEFVEDRYGAIFAFDCSVEEGELPIGGVEI